MKYLSVDLEACNSFVKGSVFSVGMVLADENFNIIFKKNYWINPLCRFALKLRKPIDFKIKKEDLADKPVFAEVRDELAGYLEDPDTIVMAHSANNDMFMFNEACKRARVKPFKMRFICTQMIYSAVYDVENGIGLDKVAVQLGRSQFTHHQADDDAEMALYLLKHCMEKLGVDYPEMIKRLGITPGRVQGGAFTSMRCEELVRLRNRRKQRAFALQKNWQREIKKKETNVMHLDPRQFDLLKCGIKTVEVRLLDEKRKKIRVGDSIYFVRNSQRLQVLKTEVISIHTYASFDEVYSAFDATALGFRGATMMEYLETLYSIYSDEEEYECGVVAFQVKVTQD
ncbi:MAG: ASCH domain-containing protein [Clostridia bacterium]|nr:ASCH domain-containing protein [Clostridia bacterium]